MPNPKEDHMSDFQGRAREMAGRVQEKVGELTGDTKTQAEGLYNRAAEQQVARLSDVIKDQPIPAILIAAAAGYLLGRLTR
jgi:uncharacterized protein YjbJ (UPF0337 family)